MYVVGSDYCRFWAVGAVAVRGDGATSEPRLGGAPSCPCPRMHLLAIDLTPDPRVSSELGQAASRQRFMRRWSDAISAWLDATGRTASRGEVHVRALIDAVWYQQDARDAALPAPCIKNCTLGFGTTRRRMNLRILR